MSQENTKKIELTLIKDFQVSNFNYIKIIFGQANVSFTSSKTGIRFEISSEKTEKQI